ncbi:hypothetical protein GSI_02989 [Ganoderma sinense ZZ0214-1]|uniref:Uncharacterized protein n=1 Tax=Ganoderma sinense ZZ0214-1 TaxID=1077348 RepID=A0A2G8SN79_9APHY|nr:hypothetical protein GSI_02989 [Ganoderma sinense ZZ0214-1]
MPDPGGEATASLPTASIGNVINAQRQLTPWPRSSVRNLAAAENQPKRISDDEWTHDVLSCFHVVPGLTAP